MQQPPRMRIAAFGDSTLCYRFERVGHTVVRAVDPSDIANAELVYLAVPVEYIEQLVSEMVPYARRGLIILHECPRYGLEVLSPLMEQGAIGLVSYSLGENARSVTAGDEIAATVAELLFGECEIHAVPVAQGNLPKLVAAMTLASMKRYVTRPVRQLLDDVLFDNTSMEMVLEGKSMSSQLLDIATLERSVNLLDNPNDKRMFKELAARAAAEYGLHDAEWWAMNKEN